jgi:hypothetical protein
MKCILSFIIVVLGYGASTAQTIDEWIKQKETQKKYLIQQIAAFKLYSGHVQNGYLTARKGLRTISNIKNGDFNLHKDFIGSFQRINPVIGKYAKVADIIAVQAKVIQVYKSASKQVKTNSLYSPSEISYINEVYTNLINNCARDIDDLISIVTVNGSEMKDDERLKRVDAIYVSVQDKYAFSKSFKEEVEVLAIQRMKQKNDVEKSRKLYGIN